VSRELRDLAIVQPYSTPVSGKRCRVSHSTGSTIMTGNTSINQVSRS